MRNERPEQIVGNRRETESDMSENENITFQTLPVCITRNMKIVILCIGVYTIHCFSIFRFIVDDAYISYLYARNLVEHSQLVPSLNTYVQGYSNFLYVLISAVAYKFSGRFHLEAVMKFFLIICGVITIYISYVIQTKTKIKRTTPLSLLLLSTSTPFIVWTVGGLETIFLSMQLTIAAAIFIESLKNRKPYPSFFLLVLTSFLTRWDAIIFFIPLLYGLFRMSNSRMTFVKRCLICLCIPMMIYLTWVWYYYGNILPTSSEKVNFAFDTGRISLGLEYWWAFLRINLNWLCLLFIILLLVGKLPKLNVREDCLYLGFSVMVYYTYVIFQGPVEMMFTFRFYTPLLPIFYILAANGIEHFLNYTSDRTSRLIVYTIAGAIILFNLLTFHCAYFKDMIFIDKPGHEYVGKKWTNTNIKGQILTHEIWKEAAIFYNHLIPPNWVGYCWSAGIFPFYVDAKIFDNKLIGTISLQSADFVLDVYPSNKIIANYVNVVYPAQAISSEAFAFPWHTTFTLLKPSQFQRKINFRYDK